MPWDKVSAKKHKVDLTDSEASTWAKIANDALKSCKDEGKSDCDAHAIRIANSAINKARESADEDVSNLEELTKKEGDKSYPASDYLVVEDPKKSTTWHLRVSNNGKISHGLMGGAWAALTDPNGYRGNKYAGPKKGEALRKLKALYKSEKMPLPGMKAKECVEEGDLEELDRSISEYYDDPNAVQYVPTYGATTFADLNAAENANESLQKVKKYTLALQDLVSNVMWSQEIDDKFAAIKALADEYVGLVQEAMGAIDEQPQEETEPAETAEAQVQEIQFAETFDGIGADILEEADAMAGDVLKMRVQIIKPGWGNSKDNHYYPIEVLARDSGVFKGIKMYETDHREAEKSTRTWVSTITDIDGFTETGAPIARVAVHDPQFAQRIRNLKAANLLDKMDCSILATGKVKSGEVDGKKGNIVEAITSANSVDWVTKAGAGGHALDLVETAEGSETVTVTHETTAIVEPVAETVITETTTIIPETEPTAEGIIEVIKEVMLEETQVTEGRVVELLAASRLPEKAKDHLSRRLYATENKLIEAIAEELTYLQEITKAGKPFGIGGQSLQESALGVSVEQANKKLSSVVNKYLP